jgi:hypothetical protein
MLWPILLTAIGVIGALAGLATLIKPRARIFIPTRRRAGILLALGLLLAGGGVAWALREPRCGCALPPVPRLMILDLGIQHLQKGEYPLAIAMFDDVLGDPDSAEIHALALYGRGMAKRASDDAAGGDADLAAARARQPDVEARFAAMSRPAPSN